MEKGKKPIVADTGPQVSRSHVEYEGNIKLLVTIFQCSCMGVGGMHSVLYKPCNKHATIGYPPTDLKDPYTDNNSPPNIAPLGILLPTEGLWIDISNSDFAPGQDKKSEEEAIKIRMEKGPNV